MDDSKHQDALPIGWRACYTEKGRVYYQNDTTKMTQWNRPTINDLNKKTWSCSSCTFDNISTSSQCEMCGTKKPTPSNSKPVNNQQDIIIKNIWKCPNCTIQNDTNSQKCQQCGIAVQFIKQPQKPQVPPSEAQNVWKCPQCNIFNNVISSICKNCNTKVIIAPNFQWIRNIDNDYELAIRLSKQLESVLEKHLGANGKGLHQKLTNAVKIYTSITKKQWPQNLEKSIRRLATIRNKLIHDVEYNKIDNKSSFIRTFEQSYCQLQSIIIEMNHIKKQNIQKYSISQSAQSSQTDDCIIL